VHVYRLLISFITHHPGPTPCSCSYTTEWHFFLIFETLMKNLGILIFTSLTTLAIASSDDKVPVRLGLMSGCPCTAQFLYDFKKSVYDDPEMRDRIDLSQVWAATPHTSKNESTCFHGKKECDFETYLVCSQHLFGDVNTLLWNTYVVFVRSKSSQKYHTHTHTDAWTDHATEIMPKCNRVRRNM